MVAPQLERAGGQKPLQPGRSRSATCMALVALVLVLVSGGGEVRAWNPGFGFPVVDEAGVSFLPDSTPTRSYFLPRE